MPNLFGDLTGAGIFIFLCFAGYALVIRAKVDLDKPVLQDNENWLFDEDKSLITNEPTKFPDSIAEAYTKPKKIKVVQRDKPKKKTNSTPATKRNAKGQFVKKKN